MRIFRRRRRRTKARGSGGSRGSGLWDALADLIEELLR